MLDIWKVRITAAPGVIRCHRFWKGTVEILLYLESFELLDICSTWGGHMSRIYEKVEILLHLESFKLLDI